MDSFIPNRTSREWEKLNRLLEECKTRQLDQLHIDSENGEPPRTQYRIDLKDDEIPHWLACYDVECNKTSHSYRSSYFNEVTRESGTALQLNSRFLRKRTFGRPNSWENIIIVKIEQLENEVEIT